MNLAPSHSPPPSPVRPSPVSSPEDNPSRAILTAWEAWANEIAGNADRVEAVSRVRECIANQESTLVLSGLGLDSLPELLPAHVRELDVSENRLRHIPSRWLPNLAILIVSENEGLELDALPPALVELHAAGCDLERLPALPDTLTVLTVPDNYLTTLSFPPHLQELWASRNDLERLDDWPESLRMVQINSNGLRSLPDRLPQNLRLLDVSENELTELPEMPASLGDLNFADNDIRDIPDSLLDLSAECLINASGNLLDENLVEFFDTRRAINLEALRMAPRASSQYGGLIHDLSLNDADLFRGPLAGRGMSIVDAISLWSEARISAAQRQIWNSSPDDLASAFSLFLRRLFQSSHGQSRAFRLQVADWLRTLEQDEGLRLRSLLRTMQATETCEDGVALTWNALQRESLALGVAGATREDDKQDVILRAREFRILEVLEGVARQRIVELGEECDEVEVFLAYPTRLAGELSLVTPVRTMRYHAPVQERHLEAARAHVHHILEPTLFQRWLNNWEPWQSYLANCFDLLVPSMLALRHHAVEYGYYGQLVTQAEREHRRGADPVASSQYTYGGREADLRLNHEIFSPLTRERFGNEVMLRAGLTTIDEAPLHERIAHEIAMRGTWAGATGDLAPNVIGALYPDIRLIINDMVISGAENAADAPVVRLALEDNHYSPIIDGARLPVARDGDCFYASILYSLNGSVPSSADITALRLRVAGYVRSRPELVAQAGLQSHATSGAGEPRHVLSTDAPPGLGMPPDEAFEEARRYLALALNDDEARYAGFALRVGQLMLRNNGVINEATASELFSEEFLTHAAEAMRAERHLPKKSSQWRQGLLRAICHAAHMATPEQLDRLEDLLFVPCARADISLIGRVLRVHQDGNPLLRDIVLIAPTIRAIAERRHALSQRALSEALAAYRIALLKNKQARRPRWNLFAKEHTNIFSHLARLASDDRPARPYAIAALRQFSDLDLLPHVSEIEQYKGSNRTWLRNKLRDLSSAPEDTEVQQILRTAQRDLRCPAQDFVRERPKLTIEAAPGSFMSTVRGLFPLVMRETQQAFGPAGWTRLHDLYNVICSGAAHKLDALEYVGMIARGLIHPQDRGNTLRFLIDQNLWTNLSRFPEATVILLRLVRDHIALIPEAEREMLVLNVETMLRTRAVHGRYLLTEQNFIAEIRARSDNPLSVGTEDSDNEETDPSNREFARTVGRALHPFTLLDERILSNRARIAVAVERRVRRLAQSEAERVIPEVFRNAGIRASITLVQQLINQVTQTLVERWQDRLCREVRNRLEELYIEFFSSMLDTLDMELDLDPALRRYLLTSTTTVSQTGHAVRTVAEHPATVDDIPIVEPRTVDTLYDMYTAFMCTLTNLVDETSQTLALTECFTASPLGPSGFTRQMERYSTSVLLDQFEDISLIEDDPSEMALSPVCPVDQPAAQAGRQKTGRSSPQNAAGVPSGLPPGNAAPSMSTLTGTILYRKSKTRERSAQTPATREQSTQTLGTREQSTQTLATREQSTQTLATRERSAQTPVTGTAHVSGTKPRKATTEKAKTVPPRLEDRQANAVLGFIGAHGGALSQQRDNASITGSSGTPIANTSLSAGSVGSASTPSRNNAPSRNNPPAAGNTAPVVSSKQPGKRAAEQDERNVKTSTVRASSTRRADSTVVQTNPQPSRTGSNIQTLKGLRKDNHESVRLKLTAEGSQPEPQQSHPGYRLGGGKGANPDTSTVPFQTSHARKNKGVLPPPTDHGQVSESPGKSLTHSVTKESRVPLAGTVVSVLRLTAQSQVAGSSTHTDSATRAVLAENQPDIEKDAQEQAKALAKQQADKAEEERKKKEQEEAEQASAAQRERDEAHERQRYAERETSESNFGTEEERRKRRRHNLVYATSPTHGDSSEARPN